MVKIHLYTIVVWYYTRGVLYGVEGYPQGILQFSASHTYNVMHVKNSNNNGKMV